MLKDSMTSSGPDGHARDEADEDGELIPGRKRTNSRAKRRR